MLSFLKTSSSIYLIWDVFANYMVAFQYMQNTLEYDTVASLDSELAGAWVINI